MTAYIYLSTLGDYLRPKRFLIWATLAIACASTAFIWKQFADFEGPDALFYNTVQALIYRVIALAAAVFATSIIAQEVEQKTIVYLFTRPIPRFLILVGKFLACWTTIFLIGVIGVLITGLIGFGGEAFTLGFVWREILVCLLGALAYLALFTFISLLFNRALIICILYAFGVELFLPNLPGDGYQLSIFAYMKIFSNPPLDNMQSNLIRFASGSLGGGDEIIVSVPMAGFILLGIGVAFLLFSMWWVSNFEYVPREDAE
jgi:ABC-2 type transport system permease protein